MNSYHAKGMHNCGSWKEILHRKGTLPVKSVGEEVVTKQTRTMTCSRESKSVACSVKGKSPV